MSGESVAELVDAVNLEFGLNAVVRQPPGGERGHGRAVFLAQPDKEEPAYVMHAYGLDEVIDEQAALGKAGPASSGQQGLQVGDKLVTIRDYAALYSDIGRSSAKGSAKGTPKTVSARDAWRYILDVLDDLVGRHAAGTIHGDICPENVGIRNRRAYLIDAGTRVRFDELEEPRRMYVAPELRSSSQSMGSMAGDVYSFLRLARSLLRPHMGSPEMAHREAQWSWMFDAAYAALPAERPNAANLSLAFPRHGVLRTRTSIDSFLDGFNNAKMKLGSSDITWLGHSNLRLSNSIAARVKLEIDRAPETILFMDVDTSSRLLSWQTVDYAARRDYNSSHEFVNLQSRTKTVVLEDLPKSIDDRWINRIHLDFYAKGIGPDHDANLISPGLLSERERARDEDYNEYREMASRIRADLLIENSFMHTEEVASLLRDLEIEVHSLDVTVMRRWGYVLAVPDHDRWLYPVFQFDPASGLPSPLIKIVNDARCKGRDSKPDEWATLSFWGQRIEALDGYAPCDLLWDAEKHGLLSTYIEDLFHV
jgi:hypothetical protein